MVGRSKLEQEAKTFDRNLEQQLDNFDEAMASEPANKPESDIVEISRRTLPKFMEIARKSTENFPFPPGEQYREPAAEFRRDMNDAIVEAKKKSSRKK